ncbi:MAG: hypothetical protein EOP45_14575 [Sphingobacteriaceae bacterium]|nr:MAG: hypothetical protein EOP45_14575 [Sphingobacteriaceae bacterium]
MFVHAPWKQRSTRVVPFLLFRCGNNYQFYHLSQHCIEKYQVPPVVRPEKLTNGRTSQDDLTIALKLVLKYNQALRDISQSSNSTQKRDTEDLLQTAVTLYYDPKYIKPTFYNNARYD